MPKRSLSACFIAFGLLLPAAALAQDKPAAPSKSDDKPAAAGGHGEMTPEQMKAVMESMNPGPAHEKLAKLAGDWTTVTKMTMAGAPVEETAGTSKIAVVLGGRFIHEEASGTMHGMEFTSAKLLGYNNGSKKYEGVWTYTMGTGMLLLSGTSADEGKTITCAGSWDNEIGAKETVTITYKMMGDDQFMVSLAAGAMPDGAAGPLMEVMYTRKK